MDTPNIKEAVQEKYGQAKWESSKIESELRGWDNNPNTPPK